MSDNASLAAQAVADAGTLAPPSFDGHGWLVVINLATMTAGTLIAAMTFVLILANRRTGDPRWSPAWCWNTAALCFATGMALRCGAGAMELWAWNPHDPVTTGKFLLVKRMIDPIAAASGLTGLALTALSMPGVIEQLRRIPLPERVWQEWPVVRRMLILAAISLVAAICVVSTR